MNQDQRFYEKYVEKNYGRLVVYASKKVDYDKEKAKDIVQESLIKVLNNLSNIKNGKHLNFYVRKAIDTTVIDEWKKKKMAFVDINGMDNMFISHDSPNFDDDKNKLMKKLIKDLKLDDGQINLLRLISEGIPPREMIKQLGLNEKSLESVKGKIKRLKKKYREWYKDLSDEEKY